MRGKTAMGGGGNVLSLVQMKLRNNLKNYQFENLTTDQYALCNSFMVKSRNNKRILNQLPVSFSNNRKIFIRWKGTYSI